MKRLCAMFLCGALLLSPTLAAEKAGFADVEVGRWYTQGVSVCVDLGLMNGTGKNYFEPEGALSYEEAVVLATRLHHILNGGNGTLPPAPEGYRTAELTFADGTPAPFQMDANTGFGGHGQENTACIRFPEALVANYVGQDFTLVIHLEETRSYTGTLEKIQQPHPTLELYDYELRIPKDTWEENRTLWADVGLTEGGSPPSWALDAFYYADREGLFFIDRDSRGKPIRRDRFAQLLNASLSDEQAAAINHITEVPDLTLTAEDIHAVIPSPLRLYNAGILTGADPYGTFYGRRGLNRAEAAVMLARALKPELRVPFTPKTPEWYLDYTLEQLSDNYMEAVASSKYGYRDAWGDLTAVAQEDNLVYLFTSGAPVRDLPTNSPGLVYLREQYERVNSFDPQPPNAGDPGAAGYGSMGAAAPYVDGVAPFSADQGFAYGYYRQDGTILIPARFSWAGALVDGVSIVQDTDGIFYRLTVTTA